YAVVVRDVTERQRAERRLREQATLLEKAQDAILIRNLDGRIAFWNHGAERLYGWSAAEAVGKEVERLLFRDNPPQLQEATSAGWRAASPTSSTISLPSSPAIATSCWRPLTSPRHPLASFAKSRKPATGPRLSPASCSPSAARKSSRRGSST